MKYFSNNPIFFQKNHKNFTKIVKCLKKPTFLLINFRFKMKYFKNC